MAPQIRNDDAMPSRESIEDRVEHRAGDQHSMEQQERRPRPALDEIGEIRGRWNAEFVIGFRCLCNHSFVAT
jgi:hypothetical protein